MNRRSLLLIGGAAALAACQRSMAMVSGVGSSVKSLVDRKPQPAIANNILDVAAQQPDTSAFMAVVDASPLGPALRGEPGPFTLLVPTNAAMAALPAGYVASLSDEALVDFISYHVINGSAYGLDSFPEVDGKREMQVKLPSGKVLGPATLLRGDYAATNGLVHIIDTVFGG